MRKFLNILSNKVTVGSILSVMVSFTFAALLRMIFADFLEIESIRAEWNISNISFLSIIALFRFIFAALLEYSLGEKMLVPVRTIIRDFDITLKMEDKNTASSSSSKDLPSSSSSKILPVKEGLKLLDDIGDNVEVQRKMIVKLNTLKSDKDLKYFEDEEGNLTLSTPSSTSDEELKNLSKQVGVIDRIIKTKFSEYRKLAKKDVDHNSGQWSKSYASEVEHYKQEYKDLFDKE